MGTIDGKHQHIVRLSGKQFSNYVAVATQIFDAIKSGAVTKDTWKQTCRREFTDTDTTSTMQTAQARPRQHTDNMHTMHKANMLTCMVHTYAQDQAVALRDWLGKPV